MSNGTSHIAMIPAIVFGLIGLGMMVGCTYTIQVSMVVYSSFTPSCPVIIVQDAFIRSVEVPFGYPRCRPIGFGVGQDQAINLIVPGLGMVIISSNIG